jgi:signal transduction histidine kinase
MRDVQERARESAEQAARLADLALRESERALHEAHSGRLAAEQALAIAEAARQSAEAARDAAELGRAAAELATLEAQRARHSLQDFLAMAAHDLRNPVAGVLGYAQLAARPRAAARARADALDAIQRSARQMDRMTDLIAQVRHVAEVQRLASTRHRLLIDAPERLDGCWDADRLAQVLTNQVTNAIKYSPDGGDVLIRVSRAGDDAIVAVTDQGIGMRAEDLPLLFRPFSRLPTDARFEGTGLGLYISWGIVAAHGGKIVATSPGPGLGSTFTISLPLVPVADAP